MVGLLSLPHLVCSDDEARRLLPPSMHDGEPSQLTEHHAADYQTSTSSRSSKRNGNNRPIIMKILLSALSVLSILCLYSAASASADGADNRSAGGTILGTQLNIVRLRGGQEYSEAVESSAASFEVAAKEIVASLGATGGKAAGVATAGVDLLLVSPEALSAAVFIGHTATDLDSVAGAIGAAALYGGTPALASNINSETAFALKLWGLPEPARMEDVLHATPDAKICLVDHQQTGQINPSVPQDNIIGIIDHHALQSETIVTDAPILVDIRPWGSMSSIVAHTFLTQKQRPPGAIAGALLSAILSDTLNLQGPTTTDHDRLMAAVLANIAHVEDVERLANRQFKAKSKDLEIMCDKELVNLDQKSFTFNIKEGFHGEIGFAVVETTEDQVILDRSATLVPAMRACKKERGYALLFLAIVNIRSLKSHLILCGPGETSLAEQAYENGILLGPTVMDLKNRVSRKKDFIPPITKVVKSGWNNVSEKNSSPRPVI